MPHHYTGGEGMSIILLKFSGEELHQDQAAQRWLDLKGLHMNVTEDGEMVELEGGQLPEAVRLLDAEQGPENLFSAIVPDGEGIRVIRGNGYINHQHDLQKSKGRTTLLNALPDELGMSYWRRMTHPDYARED